MSTEPLDRSQLQQIRQRDEDLNTDGTVYSASQAQRDRRLLLREVDRLTETLADRWQHDLANDGCVPGAAYKDLADELRSSAWDTLTRAAASHRHCDCTGTYPCEVRQIVDRFGAEWCDLTADTEVKP